MHECAENEIKPQYINRMLYFGWMHEFMTLCYKCVSKTIMQTWNFYCLAIVSVLVWWWFRGTKWMFHFYPEWIWWLDTFADNSGQGIYKKQFFFHFG